MLGEDDVEHMDVGVICALTQHAIAGILNLRLKVVSGYPLVAIDTSQEGAPPLARP